ncbi:hypothetical protein P7K49_028552 [Saguinus oedipus]|uniref:Uncharacterized protein n=1 Tax=Saguinus oedipus TaxID=9490 RepID=A0ABQ9U4N0_SAGOE|nr:hypothetical protein P7K49_028552 [Saguinus oedipus]
MHLELPAHLKNHEEEGLGKGFFGQNWKDLLFSLEEKAEKAVPFDGQTLGLGYGTGVPVLNTDKPNEENISQ